MKDKNILLIGNIAPRGMELLMDSEIQFDQIPDSSSKKEIIEKIKDKDGIITVLTVALDKEIINAGNKLKVISNYAVGFDNIDIQTAREHRIAVTNTPDVLTDATAELAISLLFACARRIVESDQYCRGGQFKRWETSLMLGTDIHHKTLGLIGAGKIGSAVAKKLAGFQMNVLYSDLNSNPELENEIGAKKVYLEELLTVSDFISIHAPYTKETHHLINKERLSQMKETAILINTARGKIIKEEDLVEALKMGRPAFAGLDVYENEPIIHPDLLTLNNVVLAPHIGSATVETRNKMAEMAVNNLMNVLKEMEITNWVNPW